MDRKELAYAIILAASLFSMSLLLFSQGTSNLSVSLSDEKPFAVAIPTMFTMNKVLVMIVLASLGTHSLTMLTLRLDSVEKVYCSLDTEAVNGSNCTVFQEEGDSYGSSGNDRSEGYEETDIEDELIRVLPSSKSEQKKKIAADILQGDEKQLYLIVCERKEILQSELVLESGLSKVKVSRLLQKLEHKSLLVRKPYGNTNKVMLAD